MMVHRVPWRWWLLDYLNTASAKNSVRKSELLKIKSDIYHRYDDYLKHRKHLEKIVKVPWNDVRRESLQHCYLGDTAPLERLKKGVIENLTEIERGFCPYCLLREPDSFDHFLPISDFPEYSVFCVNLIYVCNSCNNKKSNKLWSHPRAVINPRFDTISDVEPLIHCDVTVEEEKLILRFKVSEYSDEFTKIARRHFKEFDLNKAYQRDGSAFVSSLLSEISYRFDKIIQQEDFDRQVKLRTMSVKNEPINSWRLAVLNGLLGSSRILQYVNDRILNKE